MPVWLPLSPGIQKKATLGWLFFVSWRREARRLRGVRVPKGAGSKASRVPARAAPVANSQTYCTSLTRIRRWRTCFVLDAYGTLGELLQWRHRVARIARRAVAAMPHTLLPSRTKESIAKSSGRGVSLPDTPIPDCTGPRAWSCQRSQILVKQAYLYEKR